MTRGENGCGRESGYYNGSRNSGISQIPTSVISADSISSKGENEEGEEESLE